VPTAAALELKSDIVSRLARFFPEATAVHIPIRVRSEQAGEASETSPAWQEETAVEFRTANELFLVVRRPLQFGDTVFVESESESKSKDERFHGKASVVAAQYHVEQTVVALRFLKPVTHWIVKS
jgi:hypothetical protein